jgi:tRNA(fMet)-specific endonuclease VapC
LILDTTLLVTAERAGGTLDAVVGDEDDIAIAAVTAAELLVGVELAEGERRARRRSFVERVLSSVPVEPYDLDVARFHASLLAHTRRSDRPRGAHDLLIAATALARTRIVVSADPAGFWTCPASSSVLSLERASRLDHPHVRPRRNETAGKAQLFRRLWRRRESNPRPRTHRSERLQA